MNSQDILSHFRKQLAQRIIERDCVPDFQPLAISPWLGMSLLQKAIRRGHADLALRGAATLLLDAPDRLWRRLAIIGMEDVGLGDIEVVGLVIASLGGKRLRATLGGEWSVASFVVSLMARSARCRAADDLLCVVADNPALASTRREFARMPTRQLLEIATGPEPLAERGLALSLAVGSNGRPSHYPPTRRGEPQAVFDFLCERGFPHSVVEITREGYRKTGQVLAPFVALLVGETRGDMTIMDDEFPPEVTVGGVPGYCLDMFVREGRAAFARFLKTDCESARWIRAHVPPARQVDFLGGLIFRCEGGLMRSRMRWSVGDEMRRQMDISCNVGCVDASEIMQLVRDDIDQLNGVRAELNGGLRHG